MPFAAALSTAAVTTRAMEEVCTRALEQLRSRPELKADSDQVAPDEEE